MTTISNDLGEFDSRKDRQILLATMPLDEPRGLPVRGVVASTVSPPATGESIEVLNRG